MKGVIRNVIAVALVATAPALAATAGSATSGGECAGIDPVLAGSSFVLVRAPGAGERIASGTVVTGCSRTHEGTVGFKLLGRDGRTLASGSTTGGGFAGAAPFRFTLEFMVPLAERATLELVEPRVTEEGFEPPVISIPLVVAAAAVKPAPGVAPVAAPVGGPAAAAAPVVTAPVAPTASSELPLFASYLGTLPCADCGGIRTELRLYGDLAADPRRFELVETYLETKEGDRPAESRGSWNFSIGAGDQPNAIVIGLEIDGGERRAFVVDGKDLLLLDRAGKRIDSKLNYRLQRQP